jgi:hypothetical protein
MYLLSWFVFHFLWSSKGAKMLRRAVSLFIAGFVSAGLSQAVRADEPTAAQMADQIRQLQSKVDRLEADRAPATQPSLDVAPSAGVQGHPRQGYDPLDTNPHLPNLAPPSATSPINVGWDGNQFTIASANGNFTLHPGLTLDIRNMTTYREHVPVKNGSEVSAMGDDTQNGFDLSRVRFVFDGSLFHQVTYFFQVQADQGSTPSLLDAYVSYRFGRSPFSIKAGQFKDPIWHERNLSEANQLAVDRSLVEYYLGGGQGSRVQGAALTFDQDRFRGQLVAHDGFNSQNTKFFDAGGNGAGVGGESGVSPTNFGFSGRGEFMLIGQRSRAFNPFTEYDQFSSLHATQNILVVGAGADYSQADSNSLIAHSVDIQFNSTCGLSAYGAYVGAYRDISTNQGVAPGHYYDPGFIAQAAYVIDDKFEPFVRYDWTHLDPASIAASSALSSHLIQEVTVGANYYLYGQKAKLTLDGSWLPNGAPGDSDALGVLKDSGHYEFLLRAQLQLSI